MIQLHYTCTIVLVSEVSYRKVFDWVVSYEREQSITRLVLRRYNLRSDTSCVHVNCLKGSFLLVLTSAQEIRQSRAEPARVPILEVPSAL